MVLGGGAWGTALALTACRAAHSRPSSIALWTLEEDVVADIQENHLNTKYLPDCALPDTIQGTTALKDAVSQADLGILAIPTQHIRSFCLHLRDLLPSQTPLLCAAKGIEIEEPHGVPYQIVTEMLPNPCGILSGPNFASEVGRNLPASTAIGAPSLGLARLFATALEHPSFSCDLNLDPLGVSLGGALKNVIAIAAGVFEGLQLGRNAHGALLTHGLEEMQQLGVALSAHEKTFQGLAGLGDLILTASHRESRNYSFGVEIATLYLQGTPIAEILAQQTKTIEGMHTAKALHQFRQKLAFPLVLPIFDFVYNLLYQGMDLNQGVRALLNPSGHAT